MAIVINVPTVDQSAGNMQPFSPGEAPAPVQNYTPQQIAKLGDESMKLGSAMVTIGDKIQDDYDDAVVKKMDVEFATRAQKMFYDPQGGYLYTKGQDATSRAGATTDGLGKLRAEFEAKLENDTQRRMFARVADRHMLTWNGQIMSHSVTETRNFKAKETEARAGQYSDMAIANGDSYALRDANGAPTGPFHQYLGTALTEAKERARMDGIPEGSAQYRQLVQGVTNYVYSGVISKLAIDNKFTDAKSLLEEKVNSGEIDGKTAKSLNATIDSGYRKQRGVEAGDMIMRGEYVSPGRVGEVEFGAPMGQMPAPSSHFGPRVAPTRGASTNHNGVDYPAPIGTPVYASADGKVEAAKTGNTGYGNMVMLNHGGRVTTGYAHLDRFVVSAGEEVKKGQIIGYVGNSGTSTGPHLHYMMTNERGEKIDPSAVSRTDVASDGRGGPLPAAASTAAGAPAAGTENRAAVAAVAAGSAMRADPPGVPAPTQAAVVPAPGMVAGAPGSVAPADPNAPPSAVIPATPTLAQMLASADTIVDPDERANARAHIKQKYDERIATEASDYAAVTQKAMDIAYAKPGGWRDIPPDLWGKLKPKQQAEMRQRPTSDDEDTVLFLNNNPQEWTPGNIEKYRGLLSAGRYQTYSQQGAKPYGDRSSAIDAEVFKAGLEEAGLFKWVSPKSKSEKEAVIELRDKYQTIMVAEAGARRRDLTLEEKGVLLRQLLKPVKAQFTREGFMKEVLGPTGTEEVRAFQALQKPGKTIIVPGDVKEKIRKDLESRGIQYNDSTILNAYLAMKDAK